MRKLILLFLLAVTQLHVQAQDLCANAVYLCASNKITGSTAGATVSPDDPTLNCGDMTLHNTVWFKVLGISPGSATITVSKIDNNPGLSMRVFTGVCGSLTPNGPCTNANGPNGTMSLTFPTAAGVLYYIMVDGENGNQEAFDIVATSTGPSILAKPDANFNTNPVNGCKPLTVILENTSVINGGTGISYQWKFNGVAYPSSGADTTVIFNTVGTHSVELRVCNNECGCKSIVQDVIVQDLVPVIVYNPVVTCVGTPVVFNGSATIEPPPFVNPVINSWNWNFGDPASGANNTSTQQNPSHTFVGNGPNFVVTLIVDGTCGPDTARLNVSLLPKPVINAGFNQVLCEGSTANLSATIVSATTPIQSFQWTGPGTIACDTCLSTTVSGLAPGGPYVYTATLVDANGCITSDVMRIIINPIPVVSVSANQTICRNTATVLNSTVLAGNPPFTYSWSPAGGLNNPNAANPIANISAPTTYCVTLTDSVGCASAPSCISLNFFPSPTVSASPAASCATAPAPIQSTFTVSNAGPGSTYSWITSANYPLITSSNGDSSTVTATFPQGVAANYTFQVIVTDGASGCKDTLNTSFVTNAPMQVTVNGPFTICRGQSVTLQAANADIYTWTASPVYAFGNPNSATQIVSPTNTTVFTVTGTNGACTSTATVNVTVNPNPVAMIAAIPPVCGCSTVNLSGTGSTGGMQYTWTSNNGSPIANPGALNTTAVVCAAGSFTLLVTDPVTGCFSSATSSVTQSPKPEAVASVSPNLVCGSINTVVNLSGVGSSTAPGVTYSWTSSPVVFINNPSSISTNATVNGPTTFTFTVTASNGCDSVVTTQVNVFPAPVISAAPASICTSDPIKTATININGAPSGATFTWTSIPACVTPQVASGSSQTFNFATCPVGSYTFIVQVADVANGCVYDLSTTVDVIAGVTLTITPNQTICEGQPLTLTASGAGSYLWGGGQTTASIVVSPGLTAAGSPYNFTVTGTTGTCSANASTTVTVNPVPVTPAISGPASACQLANGVGYSVTNSPGSTYVWTANGGTVATGQGTSGITVNWTGSGTGTITVIQTLNGCAGAPQTLNVNLNAAPVTGAINGALSVCAGAAGEIYSVNPVAGNTYTWAVAGGVLANGQGTSTIAVNWASAGTGTVTVFAVSNAGCPGDTVTVNVTINPIPPAPTITGPTPVCAGSTGLTYTVSGAPGPVFNWNITNGTITAGQGTNTITVSWPTAGIGSVGLTQTSAGNCTSPAANMSVTIASNPTASASVPPLPICQGQSVQITGSASNGTVVWSSSGTGTFSNPAISSPTYTASAADLGSITLTMTVSNTPCPAATASVNVNVNPTPIPPTISGALNVCADSAGFVYTVPNNAGSTYNWTVTGGVMISGQGTSSITIDWGTAGSGSISVIETNTSNCSSAPGVMNITIHPIPAAPVISGPVNVCENSIGTVFSVPNNVGSVYTWTVSGGTIQSGQGTSSITVDWGLTGSGSITLHETSIAGCEGPDGTLNITIEALPPAPIVAGDQIVCAHSIGNIYTLTGTAGSTYTWTATGGVLVSGQGSSSINVTWSGAGSGSVSVFETTAGGCQGPSSIINITINPIPTPPVVSGALDVCADSLGVNYSVPNNVGSTYNWTVNGGVLIAGQGTSAIVVDWGSAGAGSISVIETNSFNCNSDPGIFNLTIHPIPAPPIISGPANVCENGTGTVFTVPNTAGSIYTWTASGGSIQSGQGSNSITVDWGAAGPGTISVHETSAAGCEGQDAVFNISIEALPPAPVVTGTLVVCAQSTGNIYTLTGTVGSSYTWTVTGGVLVNGQGTDSITVSWSGTGTGMVEVFETTAGGCDGASSIINITIDPIPVTPNFTGPVLLCEGSLGQMYDVTSTAGSTYTWQVNGNGTLVSGQGSANIIVDFPNPGNATIVLTETNSFGCPGAPVSLAVQVSQIPTASATAFPLTVCEGQSVLLNGTAPVGTITWTTSGNGIFSNPNIASPAYTTGSADVGTVTLTMTVDNAPCPSASASVSITVNPTPAQPMVSGQAPVCAGSTSVLYTLNTLAGLTYNWNVVNGIISGGQGTDSLYIDWLSPGLGYVIVTATNSFNCSSAPDTLPVMVNPIPVTSIINGSLSVCEGDTSMNYSVTGNPGSSYTWSVNGGAIVSGAGTSAITVNWGAAGNGTITVIETSVDGCNGLGQTVFVIINPKPVTNIPSGPLTVCEGATAVIYTTNGVGGSTFNWSLTGGNIDSGQGTSSISVTWGTAGPGTVTITEVSSAGCPGAAVVINVNISPVPQAPVISGPAAVCEQSAGVVYTLNNIAGLVYTWNVTGGVIVGSQNADSLVVNWGTAGSGLITVGAMSPDSCSSPVTIYNVNILGIPVAVIQSFPASVCFGDSIQLTANTSAGNYLWTSSGTGTFLNANTATATYLPGADLGAVTFTLTVDNAPCSNAVDSVTVIINPRPAVSVLANPTSLCAGDTTTLTANGADTYIWNPGALIGSIVMVAPSTSTWYVVIGQNSFGCTNRDSVLVTVIPAPSVNAGIDAIICGGVPVLLNGSSANATGVVWSSSGNGTFTPNNTTANPIYQPGTLDITNGSVQLILTTTGGCRVVRDTITITIGDFASINAGPDQNLPAGSNVNLNPVVSSPGILWTSNGTGVFNPNATTPNAVYQPSALDFNNGSVTLILTSTGACNIAADTLEIKFNQFFIPNVITPLPSSPGQNDYFVIHGLEENSILTIFNRWGMVVYESSNYQNDWGDGVNDDTYFYVLKTKTEVYKGYVRVIKDVR